jgi:hypothetical protein
MALDKPTDQEDEYFLRMDAEKLKRAREELDKQRAQEVEEKRKGAHFMKCPSCGSDLEEINYQDIMIDKCGDCHGIWLDAGELELLAEGHGHISKGLLSKIFG